jgi:F420-dependent oxidoreductase-like protein
MKLGLRLGYRTVPDAGALSLAREVEALGYDSVWVSELNGADAFTSCAWILAQTERIKCGTAVIQIPARTPAIAAMTAMTLGELSGGRFILGVGPSSARVVEGWHGELYGKPLTRTREYIQVIRQVLEGKGPLNFQGEAYHVPNMQPGSTGLAQALKPALSPQPDLPIFTGAVSPGGLAVAAEVADGVIPLFMDPERFDLFQAPLAKGFAKAGKDKGLGSFEIAPSVQVAMDNDLDRARLQVKRFLAPYLGAMGARANYYADHVRKLGWEEAVIRIQQLYEGGQRAEAVAAVPDGLCDQVALVGSRARIADRLSAWREAARHRRVGAMLIGGASPEALRFLAEELL